MTAQSIYHKIPNYKYYIICIANLCVFYDTYVFCIVFRYIVPTRHLRLVT